MKKTNKQKKKTERQGVRFDVVLILSQPDFLLRAYAAQTQTSMHILSDVTTAQSPTILPRARFVVLVYLKLLYSIWTSSALFEGPLTLGARGKLHPLSAALLIDVVHLLESNGHMLTCAPQTFEDLDFEWGYRRNVD